MKYAPYALVISLATFGIVFSGSPSLTPEQGFIISFLSTLGMVMSLIVATLEYFHFK